MLTRNARTLRRHLSIALGALVGAAALTAPAHAGTITGVVANDFDADGQRDAGAFATANDAGIPGLIVRAFGPDGAQVASATTAAGGAYSLAIPAAVTRVRVEFTGVPVGSFSGPIGADNGSSVQFVSVGAAQTVDGIDFTAAVPEDYCQDNPLLVTCVFDYAGLDQRPGAPAVVGFDAQKGAANGLTFAPGNTVLATKSQVGAVNGAATDPRTGDVYVAAYLKRHTAFGPAGPAAIYRIPATGARTFGAPVAFTNVPGVGADPHTTTNDWFRDNPSETYPAIGKRGLGDIDVAPSGTALLAVNLTTRRLHTIPFATGTADAGVAIPAPPGCTVANDWRPFGLGVNRGTTYVGGVCSAQTTGAPAQLTAVVLPYTVAGGFGAPVLTAPLSFSRKCGDRAGNSSRTDGANPKAFCPDTQPERVADWNPWTDDTNLPSRLLDSSGGNTVIVHPQPMLSDIEFDGSDLLLGFRDRFADQLGAQAGPPNPADGRLVTGATNGDLYRACPGAGATFVLESNGVCGALTATGGQGSGEGPGGGEFFFGDDAQPHDQTFMGGLVKIPGTAEAVSTATDPLFDAFNEGGVVWSDAKTGDRVAELRIYEPPGGTSTASFGKANGLGDIEAVCRAAPLQIGNRVFIDTDRDGVQDADEAGIAGVTVVLRRTPGGPPVATTTTDAAGSYVFSGVDPNAPYVVSVATAQGPLTGLAPTQADQGGGDTRDSDGVTGIVPGASAVRVTTGGPGENDHTYDFGFFTPRYDLALRKTTPEDVVSPGELVPYLIEVFNQSPDAAATPRDVVVTDTLPAGLAFSAADNPGWTDLGGGRIRTTIAGPVAQGASVRLALRLRVLDGATDGTLLNRAEISEFKDSGGTVTPPDVDSTPDADTANDTEVDDVIDNSGGDEDDADPAPVRLIRYDLALRKTTTATQVRPGDLVPFTITVFNQAANAAATVRDIVLTDALPAGYGFDPAENPGWSNAAGRLETTLPGPLAPGDQTAVVLRLRVLAGATDAGLANLAEIASFTDTVGGKTRPDVDSTPDRDLADDNLIDDVIDNAGGDQDDHDIARVTLVPPATTPPPVAPPTVTPPARKPPRGGVIAARRTSLTVTKVLGSRRLTAGKPATWLARVTNAGAVTARGVIACDLTTSEVVYVGASRPAFFRNGDACFRLGNIAAGDARVIRVRTRITRDATGTVVNNARVTATNAAAKRASAKRGVNAVKAGRAGGVTG